MFLKNIAIDKISANPWGRVPEEMKPIIKNSNIIFDIHFHVFSLPQDVPDGYLGIRLPLNKKFLSEVEHLFKSKIFKNITDELSHIAYFIDLGNKLSRKDIALKLAEYYKSPEINFIGTPLMMDMQMKELPGNSLFGRKRGIKGKQVNSYGEQLDAMKKLRDDFPEKFLPFVAIDPNRSNVFEDVFLKAFSPEYNFFGVKIYPALGYLPSDPTLMKIFEICEDKNIPVTTHCSDAAVHTSYKYLANIQGINQDLQAFTTNKWFWVKNDYAKFFNDPINWKPVLEAFPKLRHNFGHLGGGDELQKCNLLNLKNDQTRPGIILREFLDNPKYENVYADLSYNIGLYKIYPKLKIILDNKQHNWSNRILYGSDYYMVAMEGHFRKIKELFFTEMAQYMPKLANENPRRFLGLN